MDNKPDIGFVNSHSECYCCNNNISLFHKELILVCRAGGGIHSCMVRQSFYSVNLQGLRHLFNFLAAEAINDSRFASVILYVLDDLLGDILL